MMHYWYYNNFSPEFAVVGMLFQFAWWFFIFWLFVSVFRHFKSNDTSSTKSNSALNILKERYAKGEITKKEFDQMKKDLE